MWSSLHVFKNTQNERCLREQELKMTLPNEDDAGTARRHQHLQEQQSHGTNSRPSDGNRGGRLPDISTMIKKYDSNKNMLDLEMTPTKKREILKDIETSGCQEINKGSKNKVSRGRLQLLGNVDADSLENWRTVHPENWSNNEVMNWIYSIAEDTEEIDADLLRGEAFSGITGKELSLMSERDFIKLDDKHGSILHQLFSFLNGIDFTPPDECSFTETIPVMRELFDLPPVSPHDYEYPETPDSYKDVTSQKLHFDYDPNDTFEDLNEASNFVTEEKKSTDATIGTSEEFMRNSYSSSASTGSYLTDSLSLISGTTYSGSHESVFGCPGAAYESGPHEVPCVDHYEQIEQDYEYDPFPLEPVPAPPLPRQTSSHETVEYLKERGYRQDPRTSLFFELPESGSYRKCPGVCPMPAHCQNPQYAQHQQPQQPSQIRQTSYPSQKNERKRKRVTAPGNSTKPKQPRKSPKKTVDPNKPKSKRGRKKGQLSKDNHLWRFLLDLLKDNNCNPEHIRWENRAEGIFTIVNSAHVAELWGKKKKNDKMNYEKMSRAIRFCKTPGYIKDAPKDGSYPKKLCYAFGPNTTGWQENASTI